MGLSRPPFWVNCGRRHHHDCQRWPSGVRVFFFVFCFFVFASSCGALEEQNGRPTGGAGPGATQSHGACRTAPCRPTPPPNLVICQTITPNRMTVLQARNGEGRALVPPHGHPFWVPPPNGTRGSAGGAAGGQPRTSGKPGGQSPRGDGLLPNKALGGTGRKSKRRARNVKKEKGEAASLKRSL